MDPLVGLVGAVVIASWALSLLRAAGCVLLDTVPDPGLAQRIRSRMEIDGDRLCDLHVWQVGPGHIAVMASVVSAAPQAPAVYKRASQASPDFRTSPSKSMPVRAEGLKALLAARC